MAGRLAQFFAWAGGWLIVKVIAMFGLGAVTFLTYTSQIGDLKSLVQSTWGGLPADMIAYADLAGVPLGIGYILSAIVARAAFVFMPKITRLGS